MALCPLYGPLPFGPLLPLQRSVQPLRPSILSMALYFLNSPLSSLMPSVPSSALIPSKALCRLEALGPLYCPLSPLQLFSPLRPFVPSGALCSLYGPLSPLQPSVPSMTLCPLYGPLSPLKNSEQRETILLFGEMLCKTSFIKTPRVIAIYSV